MFPELLSALRNTPGAPSLSDFLSLVRYIFLQNNTSNIVSRIISRASIEAIKSVPLTSSQVSGLERLFDARNPNWGDWKFHFAHRIHLDSNSTDSDFETLFSLLPSSKKSETILRRIILKGVEVSDNGNGTSERRFYDLSILPLNLLLDESVVRYFIPPDDYLLPHSTKKSDPYGIVRGKSRAKIGKGEPTAIADASSGRILGSHKFSRTLLYDVDFYCPIGCSDCYKTRMGTRESLARELVEAGARLKVYHHPELGDLIPPSVDHLMEQTKKTIRWMNEDPRGQQVYDVILSGGEPLILSNEAIKSILDEFRLARNLRVFRICTGTLFLGLPFRIDDALLDIFSDFSESTGVRITIQAHLGNHHMITPEAVIAIEKIRKRGFSIYSQIPIKNGVNFFLGDHGKTVEYLSELERRQLIVGVEPYMLIVDMHPSTNAYYVPIEPLMQIWGTLVESHDYPGLERPRTLSVLFEGGNIILSGHTLFSAKKVVDRQNDRIIYTIPRVSSAQDWSAIIAESFSYDEPLIPGVNDDPDSLDRIRRTWFSGE